MVYQNNTKAAREMDILSNAKMIDLKPNTNVLWENDEGIFLLN